MDRLQSFDEKRGRAICADNADSLPGLQCSLVNPTRAGYGQAPLDHNLYLSATILIVPRNCYVNGGFFANGTTVIKIPF